MHSVLAMERKLWISALCLALILAAVSTFLLFVDPKFPLRDLSDRDEEKDPIPILSTYFEWLRSVTPFRSDGQSSSVDVAENTGGSPMATDLATCHNSFSSGGRPINCCPPKAESEEPVIDFQFPNPSSPKRSRRPAHLVDHAYIAKYQKALTLMKQLDYRDPRNFMRQANLHCIYCTGAYNQVNSSTPVNIHGSWFFFPWHRFMIYFHERILGKLIGDDTFAIPYWNWDSPPGMVIPSFYMNGSFVDKDRDHAHFPPHVADINFSGVETQLSSDEQIATNLVFMYHQMVSGAKKVELFMGCKRTAGEEGNCYSKGTIESAPHNTLHTWIGSNLQPERENMGTFYSAARDPIFYAHHANIDRLWTIWRRLRDNIPEIVDPAWLDTYFYFHDENAQLVRVKLRDCLDFDRLPYIYEEADLPWLNARPKPSIPPKIALHILKQREIENPNFGPYGRTLDTTIRTKVLRPKRYRSKKEKEEEEEVLVVYGININRDMYVKFDVFINAVDDTSIGPMSREFAGTFVHLPHGVKIMLKEGESRKKTKSSLKLGISELLEDLEAEEEESIWVSLLPRNGTGVNTSIDGIRIEYVG